MPGRNRHDASGDEAAEPSSKRRKVVLHEQQQQQQQEKEEEVLVQCHRTEHHDDDNNGEETRPWSDMIPDILEMVAGLMSIGDLIQMSRVCRQWKSAVTGMPPESRLARPYGYPCFLRLVDGNTKCALSDPLRKEHFRIDTRNPLPGHVFVAGSGRGWLLLAADAYEPSDVLFFNPLTRTAVELPKLVSTCLSTFGFTAPPTSPDCLVVAMFPFVELDATCFNYYRPGDGDWTSVLIKHRGKRFMASCSKPVFFKDRVFVLDVSGRLGVFDLLGGRTLTTVIKKPASLRVAENSSSHMLNLVEMDDELALVSADFRREFIRIYQLDVSNRQWIEMESIGDRRLSLFCSMENCIYMKEEEEDHEISRRRRRRRRRRRIMAQVWMKVCNHRIVSYSCSSANQLRTERFEEDLAASDWDTCRGSEWIELRP